MEPSLLPPLTASAGIASPATSFLISLRLENLSMNAVGPDDTDVAVVVGDKFPDDSGR